MQNLANSTQKYYAPKISDLFDGYEFEARVYDEEANKYLDIWELHTFDARAGLGHDLTYQFNDDTIRVEYLTPGQIEAKGWVYHHSVMLVEDNLVFVKILPNKLKIQLQFSPIEHHIEITKEFFGKDNIKLSKFMYVGKCPSINELRLIQKLLRI